MADGDEKIDQNDRVNVMSRMTDDKVEIIFNGVTISWKPGEVRSIQRNEAYDHFVPKSRVIEDPTGENPGVYKLVIVDQEKQPVEPGATTAPLTKAEVKELAKHGFLDVTHLDPARQFGGDSSFQLIDPETGQHPTRMELRGAPRDGRDFAPASIGRSDRAETSAALDHV